MEVSFRTYTAVAFYLGKETVCSLARNKKLSGCCGKQKNLAAVLAVEPELLKRLSDRPVTVMTVPSFPLPMQN
jgi:hypothetical protein